MAPVTTPSTPPAQPAQPAPSACRVALATMEEVPADDDWLGPRARARCAALRVGRRQRDWRLGRFAACRLLCAELGLAPADRARVEVLSAPDGAPEAWLDGRPLGLALSLSHRGGLAACALGPAGPGLGVDLERIEPRSPAFVEEWFQPEEVRWIRAAGDPALAANLGWSAKESALKVLRTGLRLDPRRVRVEVGEAVEGPWAALHIEVEGAGALAGWWTRVGEGLLTCAWRPPAGPPPTRVGEGGPPFTRGVLADRPALRPPR